MKKNVQDHQAACYDHQQSTQQTGLIRKAKKNQNKIWFLVLLNFVGSIYFFIQNIFF
jgi:Co/Zn/Cd efflux system component